MSDKPVLKIAIEKNGPYVIHGPVPLVRKQQVVSEHGEPMTWQKTGDIDTGTDGEYRLCRCGQSKTKPFCDDSHLQVNFDGTEAAETNTTIERRVTLKGGQQIVVRRDYSLCIDSGFCGNRLTNVQKMTKQTDDSIVRMQVMAMIERCPSGSYSYTLTEDGADVEPDLPQQIAVVTEILSEGPIAGPLWVTGNIAIERSDGKPFETRNRVTLCNCGQSKIKPLCDGTHRSLGRKPD
ncbi:MAG: CDGSH iron-sulfur domain-containing protein [Anaerolineae bacterium]